MLSLDREGKIKEGKEIGNKTNKGQINIVSLEITI